MTQGGALELAEQTVVVIGGSAGIGLETARLARAAGADVVVVGRDPGRLARAAESVGAVGSAAFDAGDPDRLARFFDELPGPVDHVLTTAGRPYYGLLADMDFAAARRSLDEHFWLMFHLARIAVDRVRPAGSLVFMGGTGGRRPGAGLGRHHRDDGRAAGAHRQPRAGDRARPGQPDRRGLRRHAAVGRAARRRARRAARSAARDAADRARGRAGGRGARWPST